MPKKFIRLIPVGIFLLVLLLYFLANPHPLNLFRHYVFMADAFLHGRFDIIHPPWDLGDYITIKDKIYYQYGPAPAIILMPLVYIWKTNVSQTFVSMIFGALNAVLVYKLLERLKILGLTKKLLLTIFFAFGTIHFSAAATGTTWFFGHIVAALFLLLTLMENFGKRRPLLLGLFFSLAVFSRQTILLSLPFFLLYLKKDVPYNIFFRRSMFFIIAALPLFLFNAYYNFARFGSIFDDGRYSMYLNYVNSFSPYTFARVGNPGFVTNMIDLRNIPLNLYTLFLMPPVFSAKFPFVTASPYGLSIILISPLFIYILLAKRNFLTKVSWLAITLIAAGDFLWFAQGWVHFGYRYLLDFIPFLLILLAYGIEEFSNLKMFLLVWSVIVNAWGTLYLRV